MIRNGEPYKGHAGLHRTGMRADICAAQIMAYGFTLWETITIMREAVANRDWGIAEPRPFVTVGCPGATIQGWLSNIYGWSVVSAAGPAQYRAQIARERVIV
jgi:hypothetical protein